MTLPAHIVQWIESIVADTAPIGGGHIDNEAAKYGGIALMGTIGLVWIVRPDGTFWEVDDDFGRPLTPLAPEWQHAALVSGARRYPWLAELIPPPPAGALSCAMCNGQGHLPVGTTDGFGVFCPECHACGWLPAGPPKS